ncbi:MAG: 50S ribosomal protein L19 [Bacilli bacterium]|nr:50S ribosomal protein L19 [Bacilli bacterium]
MKESEFVNLVEKITKSQIRTDLPEFRVGDTVNVGVKVKEGSKERIQYYEGLVIAIKGSGIGKNFIVRKLSAGVGVERTFPFNSPLVASVEVIRKGIVRRAKPYYVRHSKKNVKIKERN